MKNPILCEVCKETTSKYKCPNCESQYCSVGCYKNHKNSPHCTKRIPLKDKPQASTPDKEKSVADEDDKVPISALEQLKDSEKLIQILKNPHLQKLISELDASGRKDVDIALLMKEPIFIEFADECLKSVGEKD